MASRNDSNNSPTTTTVSDPPPPLSFPPIYTKQTNDDARGDLSAQLDELLNSLSNKFAGVSSEIFAKSMLYGSKLHLSMPTNNTPVDEMSRRLDNLEAQLMANTPGKEKKPGPN